jgi:hypothetical protein
MQRVKPILQKDVSLALADFKRSEMCPLQIVVISSFYYAATACKATSKEDLVRYKKISELVDVRTL